MISCIIFAALYLIALLVRNDIIEINIGIDEITTLSIPAFVLPLIGILILLIFNL